MVQVHVGPQALVFPVHEVLHAPDPHGAVVGTGGQVLAVAAKVNGCDISAVALA